MSVKAAPSEPGTSQTGSSDRDGTKRREWNRTTRADAFWGYAMIAPGLIGLLVFYIWPMIQTFYFSFTEWGPFGDAEWTGLANYRELFRGTEFLMALRNTLVYTVLSVSITEAIALVLAVLLNQKLRGMSVYRTLYFIPVVTMPVAIGLVWRWLYNSDYGVINYVLSLVGIEGANWLSDPNLALYAIVVVGVWSGVGYALVLFLAGLQTIPRSLYEAAEIDGASKWQQFWEITLPMLRPAIVVALIFRTITAIQTFDIPYAMTNGGPGNATETLAMFIHKTTIDFLDLGYGSALAVLMFIVSALATAGYLRYTRRDPGQKGH